MIVRKWYLDCVADDGMVWIGYCGEVRRGPLRVPFVSSMQFDGRRSIVESALRSTDEPRFEAGRLVWTAPSIQFELRPWTYGSGKTLAEGVTWHCHVPAGDATVRMAGRTLRGTGYAETLELCIAPWSLPIRQLRWGHAISAKTSLVWIDWTGPQPLRLILQDGVPVSASQVGDDEVRTEDGADLLLRDPVPIREESLASLLAPFRPIARFLPAVLSGAIERKWRSRFATANDEGWAIHELITFAAD